MKIYSVIIIIFCSTLNLLAQDKTDNPFIIVRKFGGTAEYSYQNANIIGVGPNFCIGAVRDKSHKGTNFYSIEALYCGVIKKGKYYNGFKAGVNYNYTGNKGIGINSNLHCLAYEKNVLLIPSIGISYFGIVRIEYGYAFKLTPSISGENYSPHQIGIKLFLNKTLGLMFKSV
jgi:hypothetical protein